MNNTVFYNNFISIILGIVVVLTIYMLVPTNNYNIYIKN